MDHHRGPIRIGIRPQARGAQRHQGIGPSGVGGGGIVFSRHPRHSLGQESERSCHHGPGGRGKLRGEAEAPAVVGPPPGHEAASLGIQRLLDRSRGGKTPIATDGRTRDPSRPGTEPSLGLGGGEPAELHDLVDRQHTGGQRVDDTRQVLQGAGRRDPATGLPVGDPVAHGQPVGHVSGTPVSPQLPAIPLRDELEHRSLGITDSGMAGVDALDQLVVGLLLAVVHPDLTWGHGGGGTPTISNTRSIVKSSG